MSKQYEKGKALFEHYKGLYMQHLEGKTPSNVSSDELQYAIEVVEIANGKYGECAGVPSEAAMWELLEKAEGQKRKVGFIEYATERTDAATGMVMPYCTQDAEGYIGIL